jgi:hypothetical protein
MLASKGCRSAYQNTTKKRLKRSKFMLIHKIESTPTSGFNSNNISVSDWINSFSIRHPEGSVSDIQFTSGLAIITYTEHKPVL